MNQPYQQFDPKTIETLKAARNQVVQVNENANENKNVVRGQSLNSREALHHPAKAGGTGQAQFGAPPIRENFSNGASNKFAEEFVQKLASLEQETTAVDEEMAKLKKIWLNLTEKKKQLEARRNELTKVKDKLKELDKEMSDVLKSQSV